MRMWVSSTKRSVTNSEEPGFKELVYNSQLSFKMEKIYSSPDYNLFITIFL